MKGICGLWCGLHIVHRFANLPFLLLRSRKEPEAVLKALAVPHLRCDLQGSGAVRKMKVQLDQSVGWDFAGDGRAQPALADVLGAAVKYAGSLHDQPLVHQVARMSSRTGPGLFFFSHYDISYTTGGEKKARAEPEICNQFLLFAGEAPYSPMSMLGDDRVFAGLHSLELGEKFPIGAVAHGQRDIAF